MNYKELAKNLAKEPTAEIALFFENLAEALQDIFDKNAHKDYIDIYDEMVDLAQTQDTCAWEMFYAIYFKIAGSKEAINK